MIFLGKDSQAKERYDIIDGCKFKQKVLTTKSSKKGRYMWLINV